jgi:DNA gyrase subunit B
MDVISKRDGNKYTMHFKRGEADGELITKPLPELQEDVTGTFIKWKPDDEVFTDTNITFKMIRDYCDGQAHINNVNMHLVDEAHPENNITIEGKGIKHCLTSKIKGVIIDTFDNSNMSSELKTISGKTPKGVDYSAKIDFVIAITEECSTKQLYFHNTAEVHGGQHDIAFRNALADSFKDVGKTNDVVIQPYDYNDYVSIIISTYSNITSFANQTKDSVNNDFIYALVYRGISEKLKDLKERNNAVIKGMVDSAVMRAKARKAAKEAEMLARKAKKAVTNKRSEPEKFKACVEKDPKKRELFIVEGDSALGSCKDARNSDFQALIPVRGKILNCLKASLETILKSQIISDLIQVLGCGIDIGGSDTENLFDINKLKYDKIIICTDADEMTSLASVKMLEQYL